jgi:hypothetical protein
MICFNCHRKIHQVLAYECFYSMPLGLYTRSNTQLAREWHPVLSFQEMSCASSNSRASHSSHGTEILGKNNIVFRKQDSIYIMILSLRRVKNNVDFRTVNSSEYLSKTSWRRILCAVLFIPQNRMVNFSTIPWALYNFVIPIAKCQVHEQHGGVLQTENLRLILLNIFRLFEWLD